MSIKKMFLVISLIFTSLLVSTDIPPFYVAVPEELQNEFRQEFLVSERELERSQQRQLQNDIAYLEGLSGEGLMEAYLNPRYREIIINSVLREGIAPLRPLPENEYQLMRIFIVLPALTTEQQATVLSQLTQTQLSRLVGLSPAHRDLFDTYRQNITELDLTREGRIDRDFIEQMGETYPNVQRIIINASSTERMGHTGITPKLAKKLIEAFSHLKFVRILGCDFGQPSQKGLMTLSMLKIGDNQFAVEYTQKCAERA